MNKGAAASGPLISILEVTMKRNDSGYMRFRPRNREHRSRKGENTFTETCRHQWSGEGICLKCGAAQQEIDAVETKKRILDGGEGT